jgi:hypothetical protein
VVQFPRINHAAISGVPSLTPHHHLSRVNLTFLTYQEDYGGKILFDANSMEVAIHAGADGAD